jgi:hypothetical protein
VRRPFVASVIRKPSVNHCAKDGNSNVDRSDRRGPLARVM